MAKTSIEVCGNCIYYFKEKVSLMGEKREIGFCCLAEPKRLKGKDSEPCEKYRRGLTSS